MKLEKLSEDRLVRFKTDIKAAFRFGASEGMGTDEEVLPEENLLRSLNASGAVAYMAIDNGEMVGGAIVVIDELTQISHLDFLYVKVGQQGKKIGQYIWKEIEKRHPDTDFRRRCNLNLLLNRQLLKI